MAPATEECSPPSPISTAHPTARHVAHHQASDESVDPTDPTDDVSPTAAAAPADSSCCYRCSSCACWQHRNHSRPPRGTDKVGGGAGGAGSSNETLLSGGKTRFYCCESKMTTRPGGGPNSARNPRNSIPETAIAVSPGLCSLLKVRCRNDSDVDEVGVSPVDFAFDAFDERAYLEEFEVIHQEEYDITRTIVNPVTPHSEVLLHPSQVGRVIIIKGKMKPHAQRFAVNLICRENNDIAMHFNPRLDRGYIARNSKLNGTWGIEENSLNGPSPFQADKEFTLQILVTDEEYRFCHNGRHVCSYAHRVPIARLRILDIHGDLTLSMVRHQMVEEFPPPCAPVSVDDLTRDPQLLSVGHTPLLIPTSHSWRADIPKQSYFFLGRFEPNLSVGNEIVIGGSVRLLPHAFFVNLQDGLQMWRPPAVHFHINPRFEDHNHTVVNARLKGAWGYEERHTRCHFQPGRPFTLTIRVEEDRFRALVNGAVVATMDHRARPSEINSLYISGDVDITSVGFNKKLSAFKSIGSRKGVKTAEDDWIDLNDDIHPREDANSESSSPEDDCVCVLLEKDISPPEPESRNREKKSSQDEALSQSNGPVPKPCTSKASAVSEDLEPLLQLKKSGSSRKNSARLSAVVDRNPALSYSSESVAAEGRLRGDSLISDDIFLSAQHSLEPSISSNRNSLDENTRSDFVSSMSENKTDNKPNGKTKS